MTPEQIEELAALYAAGALDGAEREAFAGLLRDTQGLAHVALSRFQDVVVMAAGVSSAQRPSAGLKEKVLAMIHERQPSRPDAALASLAAGFQFVPQDDTAGWRPMQVQGAYIKLLSYNPEGGYAVMLGRIDAGVQYPAHVHSGSEDLFILTGDLHIGDLHLRAGDFHHADAGTAHGVNYSDAGCTLLAVVRSREVLAELGVG